MEEKTGIRILLLLGLTSLTIGIIFQQYSSLFLGSGSMLTTVAICWAANKSLKVWVIVISCLCIWVLVGFYVAFMYQSMLPCHYFISTSSGILGGLVYYVIVRGSIKRKDKKLLELR